MNDIDMDDALGRQVSGHSYASNSTVSTMSPMKKGDSKERQIAKDENNKHKRGKRGKEAEYHVVSAAKKNDELKKHNMIQVSNKAFQMGISEEGVMELAKEAPAAREFGLHRMPPDTYEPHYKELSLVAYQQISNPAHSRKKPEGSWGFPPKTVEAKKKKPPAKKPPTNKSAANKRPPAKKSANAGGSKNKKKSAANKHPGHKSTTTSVTPAKRPQVPTHVVTDTKKKKKTKVSVPKPQVRESTVDSSSDSEASLELDDEDRMIAASHSHTQHEGRPRRGASARSYNEDDYFDSVNVSGMD